MWRLEDIMRRSGSKSILSWALAIGLVAIGCDAEIRDENPLDVQASPAGAPLYFVDIPLGKYHSSVVAIRNDETQPIDLIFDGVSCACLQAEHRGKGLSEGDTLRIEAGAIEQIDLHNELSYEEGFHSETAMFRALAGRFWHISVKSEYCVIRRLVLSPGALIFERERHSPNYAGTIKVRYRSVDERRHTLEFFNFPKAIQWHIEKDSIALKRPVTAGAEKFYEHIWNVNFDVREDNISRASLPPHGDAVLRILNSDQSPILDKSFSYNALIVSRGE
jgi:hypothetical protein